MGMNVVYSGPEQMPAVIPVFPLPGALLLPRGQLPLNIFEPRYLAMLDDAIRGHRLIGMIQPQQDAMRQGARPALYNVGCAGRVTQFAETGDGRCIITLTGVARFRVASEMPVATPYRQCQVDFTPFAADFDASPSEPDAVDRPELISTLKDFVRANRLNIDWREVDSAPTEALVNALSMMCPFGAREKQALLEAATLQARAEALIAIARMDMQACGDDETPLQ